MDYSKLIQSGQRNNLKTQMNKSYRLIYNPLLGQPQVAPECAKGHGKSVGGRSTQITKSLLQLALVSSLMPSPALAGSSNWIGTGASDNWFDNSNWEWGPYPTAVDDARIDNANPVRLAVSNGAASSLFVGITAANSQLTVQSGLTTINTTLGYNAGSSGTVSLQGVGTTWNNAGILNVGNGGTGTITLGNGTIASSGTTYLGGASGASGFLTVGPAASYTATGTLFVGYGGHGEVNASDNGQVTSQQVSVADGIGSTGAINLSTGADWIATGNLIVGNAGVGQMSLLSGSTMQNSGNGVIGNGPSGGTSTVLVDGNATQWSMGGTLFVGAWGNGQLTIQNEGQVSSLNGAVIARGHTSTSTATVTGAGSLWQTGTLRIGGDATDPTSTGGNGTLNILSGGEVVATQVNLGDVAGSIGTVLIRGTDSSLSTSAPLSVGRVGTGHLTVDQGGSLTTTWGLIGHETGSAGTVTVTGAGSSWVNTGNLYVGNGGKGILRVSGNATASAADTYIGTTVNSTANSLDINSNASFTSNSLYVGYGGTGFLTLANNSQLTSQTAAIGTLANSEGFVTLGNASSWNATGNLYVGSSGVGHLLISSGSNVTNTGTGTIAHGASGFTSTVLVEGAGSAWNNGGSLFVGALGNGQLTIQNGGLVSSLSGAVIARGSSSTSTVTVTGSGSRWETGTLAIGGDVNDPASTGGNGTLNILGGGEVEATRISLGDVAGAQGQMTLSGDGSSLTASDRISVGRLGIGTLNVNTGASITAQGGLIGHEAGSTGTVTISGTGSQWLNSGVVYVGNLGNGALTVSDGALLTSTDGYVGTEAGSTSTALITGANSAWIHSGDLLVGHNNGANGTLTIADGATVSDVQGLLGDLAGSSGTLTVTGTNSRWLNSSDVNVGRFGQGNLTVANGGQVTGNRAYIANEAGSSGTALVSGSGSQWSTTNRLFVGLSGSGTLTVNQGGTVQASEIVIAQDTGSSGTLNVGAASGQTALQAGLLNASAIRFGSGTGNLVFNMTDTAYALNAPILGNGTLKLESGGLVLGGQSTVGGGTEVSGGRLIVGGSTGSTASLTSNIQVAPGALLGGHGTILGDVTLQSGATLAPGNSIGILSVTGNVAFTGGSRYEVELSPGGIADLLDVTGNVSIAPGTTLDLLAENGTWAVNTPYTFIAATGGVTGNFTTVNTNLAFLTPNLNYDTNALEVIMRRNNARFASVGNTYNQRAAAAAAEALRFGNPVYDAIVALDAGGARQAFDSISGEIHASAQSALLEESRYFRDSLNHRLRTVYDPARTNAPLGAELWMQGYGNEARTDSNGNSASIDRNSQGIILGWDTGLGNDWQLGAALNIGTTQVDADHRKSDLSADNHGLAVYGGGHLAPFRVRAGAAYTWSDMDSTRRARIGNALNEQLKADYNQQTAQVFAEVGYPIQATQALALEPYVNLAHARLSRDSFKERGGNSALRGESESASVSFGSLGVHTYTELQHFTLQGSLAWQHASGELTPESRQAFAGSPSFKVQGAPIAQNSVVARLGLMGAIGKRGRFSLDYNGQWGDDSRDQGVRASIHMPF